MLTLALCRHICERILRLCHMETNTSFDDERGRTDGKRRQKVRLFSSIRAKRRRRTTTQKTPLITRSEKDDRFGTHFCLSLSLSSKWKDFELTHMYALLRASSPPPGPWLRERRHHRRRGQALPERPIRPSERDQQRRRVRPTAKIHRRVGRPRDGRPRRSARGRHSRKLRRLRGDFERALKLRPTHGIRERVLSDRIQRKRRSVTRDREHGREIDARPRGARRLGLRRRARKKGGFETAARERREMMCVPPHAVRLSRNTIHST